MATDRWGFDLERQATARRLRVMRLRLSAVRAATFAALTIALIFGAGGALRDVILLWVQPPWASSASFVAALFAAVAAVEIPFAYVGYRWEMAFGLSAQSLSGWSKDLAKSLLLGLGWTTLAGTVLLWLLAISPIWWWLIAWGLGLVATFVLGLLAPIVLVPLFYRFRPLGDTALRARFEALAAKANVPIVGVFELRASEKTRRSNAAVMGLGRTRRVVLTDTLLHDFRPEEVETVLAHELAHQKHLDPVRGFVVGAATALALLALVAVLYAATFPALGVRSAGDMAGLPLLAALLGILTLPLRPLELFWSRVRESRADRFSLELTRDPASFATAMQKLHDGNLGVADPKPWEKWLFYSHPSGRERVDMARTFRVSPP